MYVYVCACVCVGVYVLAERRIHTHMRTQTYIYTMGVYLNDWANYGIISELSLCARRVAS